MKAAMRGFCFSICSLPLQPVQSSGFFSAEKAGHEGGKQYEAAAVWFTWRKATCETQLDGNLIAAHVANESLMLLSMISFGRIMLNININTYTIDFSSVPALKEQEFQSEEKGGIQLH